MTVVLPVIAEEGMSQGSMAEEYCFAARALIGLHDGVPAGRTAGTHKLLTS